MDNQERAGLAIVARNAHTLARSIEEVLEYDAAKAIKAVRPTRVEIPKTPTGVKEVKGEWPDKKYPSHVTRGSDASSFDEVCVHCGATDRSGGGWGALRYPCPYVAEQEAKKKADGAITCDSVEARDNSPRRVLPLVIRIALACYSSEDPKAMLHPQEWDSPSGKMARQKLLTEGLIDKYFDTTERGRQWVEALCQVPFPPIPDTEEE